MKFLIFGGLFELDKKISRIDELNKIMNDQEFWSRDDSNDILNEASRLKKVVNPVLELKKNVDNNIEILSQVSDNDTEILELVEEEYINDSNLLEKLKLETYLSGEYDHNNCILEIHAGAGGTESCDWANMLYRMYSRYLEKHNYKIELLDRQPGEEVGIKSVMIRVVGENAYGYLKGEKGVHRLVRISPFDSNKRRHTSFASVEITPEIDKSISVVINDKDLKIDIYRSSGPGGQGVNTTDSAVRITHLPTGIVVTCQNERSQIQNKEHCLEVLKSKLYALELEKKNKAITDMKKGRMANAFGSGKRSYVMCPYTRVIDNDSLYETSDVESVLDGNIDEFIINGLRK